MNNLSRKSLRLYIRDLVFSYSPIDPRRERKRVQFLWKNRLFSIPHMYVCILKIDIACRVLSFRNLAANNLAFVNFEYHDRTLGTRVHSLASKIAFSNILN